MVATLAGFVVHGTWRVLPAERVALSLVLALLAWTLAWPLKRWLGVSWATALVAVWFAALTVYAGPLPVLAASALGLGALSIGVFFLPAWLSMVASAAMSNVQAPPVVRQLQGGAST